MKNKEKLKKEEKLLDSIEKLSARIDVSGLRDYIESSKNPWSIIWRNFLAGVSRGVGLTVGATIVVAVIIKVLYGLIQMNIPYLTDLLNELVVMIKSVQP